MAQISDGIGNKCQYIAQMRKYFQVLPFLKTTQIYGGYYTFIHRGVSYSPAYGNLEDTELS